MKRIFIIAAALLLLTGCGSSSGYNSNKTQPVQFEETPGEIAYGDTTISLSKASFAEVYASHGYTGYCVVTIARNNLTDDDVYWMLKKDIGDLQEEFEVNAYLTSEENSLDGKRMSQLPTIYDSENIYFFFFTDEVQRKHLSDFQISIQMIMSPEKDLTANSTQYYYFDFEAEDGIDYSNYEEVFSDKERKYLVDALNQRIDSLK